MHDLFWQTDAIVSKPKKYRAPSWSWASFDGKITWPSWRIFDSCIKCTSYCTILDAHTTPIGLDPCGAINDAFLKIRGVLKQVTVVLMEGDRSQHSWRLCHNGQEIGHVNLDIAHECHQEHSRVFQYHALIISKCESPMEEKARARGLLVEKKDRKRDGWEEFVRVGTFALFADFEPDRNQSLGIWDKAEQVIMIV